jgi:hypothetical protein
MDAFLALLQWPAMATSLAAAWWMGSRQPGQRVVAFCVLIAGNLMWIGWGWGERAWGLIALNVGLMAFNVRGIVKNERA